MLKNFILPVFVALITAMVVVGFNIPIRLAELDVHVKYIKNSINSIHNELKDTNAKVYNLSNQVALLLGKIAALEGVDTKELSAINESKGLTKEQTTNTLQGVIEKPSFETKQRFLQNEGYTPNQISSILTTPKNKSKKLEK